MAHHHEHDSPAAMQDYLTQQIVTIAVSGAIGAVAVSLYMQNKLKNIVALNLHLWILVGGVALLAIALIRGIALWRLAGELQKKGVPEHGHDDEHAHQHEHGHEHAHHHEHSHHEHEHHHEHVHAHAAETSSGIAVRPAPTLGLNVISGSAPDGSAPPHGQQCCDHDHEHVHDHGHDDHVHDWAPWRFVLLLLPVALFLLNMPSEGFSEDYQKKTIDLGKFDLTLPGEGSGEEAFNVRFLDLEMAATYPEERKFYAGKTVRLSGKFSGLDDTHFTLVRFMMKCCAADAVKLNAIIWVDPSKLADPRLANLNPQQMNNKWVIVTGRVHFIKNTANNQYMPAVILTPTKDEPLANLVKSVPSDPNPYDY